MIDYNHAIASGLVGGFSFFLSLIWKWIPLLLLVAVLKYVVPRFLLVRQRQRLSGIGIADIDTLDGKQFEVYLEARFRARGYRVQRTPYQGDWGADLILEKDGVRTAVQAKRYQKNVGVRAVQEAAAAKGKYGCDQAMVVINSQYTKAAVELAAANAVELWGRERLLRELLAIQPEDLATIPADATDRVSMLPTPKAVVLPELADAGDAAVCAVCGKMLTPKIRAYCRANAEHFRGQVLCFEHQKAKLE